ncbi:MAG: hypothetical protein GOU98_01635 [Candidatus Altiarchaeota archaeon]|nr:hypothetical protein [Candidatus Altiarchaeota archaeon]
MSYQVTVIGFDFTNSQEFEGESLRDALESMGAKTVSYGGLGSFVEEISGVKYKQDAGGIYTWLLSKKTNDGTSSVDFGINLIKPKEGDHIFAMYEFIPDSKPQVGPNYESVTELKIPDELDFPEYEFTKLENYLEVETINYSDFDKDEEEVPIVKVELFSQKDYLPQIERYETFNLFIETSSPALTPINLPEKLGQKRLFSDATLDSELENFLMDVLVEAKNSRVLDKIEAVDTLSPLILA